jgi:FtsP/CotA-like multicopper oxidase with cupredoxin domain
MATIEYWIQIENHAWDTVPHRFDRMTGDDYLVGSKLVNLTSPVTLATRSNVRMYKPLMDGANVGEALILRRYTKDWAAPDDRKVNPWDLNEPDPTDAGTMGTIPGPVIECNAGTGDTVLVHFRNMDSRAGKDIKARTHSLHPHGFVFKPTSDGAYPLSPPDPSQPVAGPPGPNETALWNAIGVTGPNKMGDRIPPGGTFTYTWNTFGWPTTAGVWLYHDHSICDMDNVNLGAIGIIVIHNLPADSNNDFVIDPADLPDGSFTGSPVIVTCFPFPTPLPIATLPNDLSGLGLVADPSPGMPGMPRMPGMPGMPGMMAGATKASKKTAAAASKSHANVGPPVLERLMERGGMLLEADAKFDLIARFCIRHYRTPPTKAMYLQLFHELTGAPGMAINGRVFLGNTPTMIAGTATKMRFGVVGMGNNAFHTFHIHGHRWIVPGPDGNNPVAIQGSPQVKAISQFEDTRIFGPANSFGFTINGASGSFMRAGSPAPDDAKGEWHMHCHVLGHMMAGMMGSLLIIGGGEIAGPLPVGVPCPSGTTATPNTVVVKNTAFTPNMIAVPSGTTVNFDFQESFHSVTTTSHTGTSNSIEINGGPGGNNHANAGTPVPVPPAGPRPVMVTGSPGDVINYQCGIHLAAMTGMIQII